MPTVWEIGQFLKKEQALQLADRDVATSSIGVALPIAEAKAGSIAFLALSVRNAESVLASAGCSFLILDQKLAHLPRPHLPAVLLSDDPRLDFLRVVGRFFAPPRPQGIHPTAVVSSQASIGQGVYIGPLCVVGNAVIGDNAVLHSGVHIYDGVYIGRGVTIHSGTVIGADGFGYHRNEAGELEKFPHVGGVHIEDDVEIGANTCIDRGTLGNTHIKKGARIDNLVHIAHNVVVGEHAAVIAHAMIGGSTIIGDKAWIAPAGVLRDKLHIGAAALVGLGAVVVKDVDNGEVVMGAPARPLKEYKALLTQWRQAMIDIDKREP